MKMLMNWLISAVAIMIAAYILPGVMVDGFVAALVLAVILGAINATLGTLLHLLTLPINILTLGLFALVVNAALVMLAALIVPGFAVASFWWAMLFAVVLSAVTWVFEEFGRKA